MLANNLFLSLKIKKLSFLRVLLNIKKFKNFLKLSKISFFNKFV